MAVAPLPSTRTPTALNAMVLSSIATREFLLATMPVPQFVKTLFRTVALAIPAEVSTLRPAVVQFLIVVLTSATLVLLVVNTSTPTP